MGSLGFWFGDSMIAMSKPAWLAVIMLIAAQSSPAQGASSVDPEQLAQKASTTANATSIAEPEQPESHNIPVLAYSGPAGTTLSQTLLKPAATALPAPPAAAAQPPYADQATAIGPPQTVDAAELSRVEPLARRERAHRQFLKLYDDGNYERSIVFAAEVVDLTREIFGKRSIELADPMINLASVYRNSGNTQSAQATYSAAIEIIEDNNDMLSAELINPLIGLGATYNDAGLHELGLRTYQRALHVNHVNGGFYNFEQIPVRDGLTESYLGLEEFGEADFEQTVQVSIYEREYGQNKPTSLPAMYKLADWYRRTGQFEEEQSIYTRALRIIKQSGGKTDPLLVDTYRRYAILYRSQALDKEAIRAQKRAIEINQAQPEPNIAIGGDLLVDLGDCYITFGHSRRAGASYNEAWQTFAADPELYGERLEAYFSKPKSVRHIAIPATYPRTSRNRNTVKNASIFGDGIVMARYTVSDRGRVENVEIIESDPPNLLDDKVAYALRNSYFRPEFQDGLPVSRPDMIYVHEFKYDKTALKVVGEKNSDQQERLPNPNALDNGSNGAM